MSLLQRMEVYQKTDHKHPAFRPIGVINSDVSELTEADEDVPILNGADGVPERAAAAVADGRIVTEYIDSEKWCGDERTKYTVLKVEATSFVLAVVCVALALVLVGVMFPDEFLLIGP